jgi:hypothetical protein
MGLMDRDYMRQRKSDSSQLGSRKASAGPLPDVELMWFVWVLLAGLGLALAFAGGKALVERNGIPFPTSGKAFWYVEAHTTEARFTVTAPAKPQRLYAVRLDDATSGQPVVMVPLRSGETHEVKVPFGRFKVTMASGSTWFGPDRLFGLLGEHKKSVNDLHFYRTDDSVMGHHVDLAKRLDGNMPTRAALPFEK